MTILNGEYKDGLRVCLSKPSESSGEWVIKIMLTPGFLAALSESKELTTSSDTGGVDRPSLPPLKKPNTIVVDYK